MSTAMQLWVGAVTVMGGASLTMATLVRSKNLGWRADRRSSSLRLNARQEWLSTSRWNRLVAPVILRLTRGPRRLLGPLLERRSAAQANEPTQVGTMVGVQIARVLLAGLGVVLSLKMTASASPNAKAAITILVSALCWFLPGLYVARRADARIAQINRELPDILDQITISLSAGLGIDAALSRVADRNRGVLAEELRRTMTDIRIGLERSIAFENLATRTRSEDLALVTGSITQGLEVGAHLTPVLVARAEELRRRRRADAEERAHKTSVKLALPTALCILPALLLILLGPAILQIVQSGFGS